MEASLIFPLFLFAAVTLMTPFSMMNRERKVQAVLESVTEDISQLAYKKDSMGQATWIAYAQIQVRRKLDIQKLSLLKSQILEDGETINLVAEYELALPFPIFSMKGIAKVNGSYRRAWVGKEGGRQGDGTTEERDEEIVYVGKSSTRYHKKRTCHYLYNQFTVVLLEHIDQHHNLGGGRYKPCDRCGHGSSKEVYIMPSGERYHSTTTCSAIVAYVKAVKKSEVEHLSACSYCSGG